MKAAVALSLLLFAQNSLQDDSPAQKACKALQDKYPKLTAYDLDPRYIEANTGALPDPHDIYASSNGHRLLYVQRLPRPSMRL